MTFLQTGIRKYTPGKKKDVVGLNFLKIARIEVKLKIFPQKITEVIYGFLFKSGPNQ